jgi:hypothetical protein
MIQFDGNGDGHPLPEEDGTIDLQKRALELRFLKVLKAKIHFVPLSNGAFFIDASSPEEPDR